MSYRTENLNLKQPSSNPINKLMGHIVATIHDDTNRIGRRCGSCATFLVLALLCGTGCGLDHPTSGSEPAVEIIKGTDSAGATVELEKHGTEFTRARVIDVVLGTAEAPILLDNDGHVTFTIDFPAGASLTYVGTIQEIDASQEMDASSPQSVEGTWMQHETGLFASDAGTWEAAFRSPQVTNR